MDSRFIIAGLGNPGSQYDGTRHNIGFEVVDALADQLKVKVKKLKFESLYADAKLGADRLLLLKPQTFMNESGRAVRAAAAFYKVPPERVLVVVDDVNLPAGRLRLRESGSDGGHNGLKSLLYHLQSDRFPRLRVGVGAPAGENALVNWVLGGYSTAERKLMDDAVKRCLPGIELFVQQGAAAAANLLNRAEVTP